MDDWSSFCGFSLNESSFINKFVFNQTFRSLTPCSEFGFVVGIHFIFLFYTVLGFFHLKSSTRIPTKTIRFIIYAKLLVSILTCILIISASIFAIKSLPSILIIEYSLIFLIWLNFSFVWVFTIHYNTWTRPTGLSVSYCLAVKAFVCIVVQRWLVYGFNDHRTLFILTILLMHVFNLIFCKIEYFQSRAIRQWEHLVNERFYLDDKGDEGANYISRLLFLWTNPLIQKGYNGQIKESNDLFKLPPSLRVLRVEREFLESAQTQFTDAQLFSFSHALIRAFGLEYFSLGALNFVGNIFKFVGPILLHLLITAIQSPSEFHYGYYYAAFMLLSSFLSSLSDFNFNFYVTKISFKVRCAILTAVYDKLLNIPLCRLSKFSAGQLINFMSTDVDRIVGCCVSLHAIWSMPLNLGIALYLIYREVGLAFLSGLGAALLIVPINKCIVTKIGTMSTKMMFYKDQRMRLITETLRSIRTVKLNNWEFFFEDKINKIRLKELKYLRARKYLDAICVYLWASAPILITIAILFTYTIMFDEQLTAAKVFTCLALVNILITPLNAFPWVLNSVVEAYVSKKRFDNFFAIENSDPFSLYTLTDSYEKLLQIENATFSWANSNFQAKNISFCGKKGQIIGIIGPVASGKSSILLGILGEAENTFGSRQCLKIRQRAINEGFAYLGQDCWLQRTTIRENIVCGSQYREDFYQRIIKATLLDHDIEKMPDKNDFVVGDEGQNLSGGQRARVALARAVYQDNEVYLLDEPFASLDINVGKYVMENCIDAMLRQKEKLVVLCTHRIEYLQNVDYIIKLNTNGEIETEGPANEILSSLVDSPDFKIQNLTLSRDDEFVAEPILNNEANLEEEKEKGTVKLDVYSFYLKATGYTLVLLIGLSLSFMQLTKNGSDIWLAKWTLNTTSKHSNLTRVSSENLADWNYPFGERPILKLHDEVSTRTIFYLSVYVGIACANSIFTLLRAFLFAYGGIVAARNLHKKLLKTILNSTISWWDRTPLGRVVNRLCSDVYVVDDSLPFQANICLAAIFNLVGVLAITMFSLPFLIPFVILLFVAYYFIQRYYRFTTCEIKRISSLTLSPLYSHITDSVTGLVTIRAQRFGERFTSRLRDLLDKNLSAQYSSLAATQWLSVRLQLLGVGMISIIAFTGILEAQFFNIDTGLIALAITYALSATNLINSLLCSFVETEKELVSVERISDYIENVKFEETSEVEENLDRFLFCNTIKGQIDFTCVSLRYGPGLPWALKNVTLRIEAGQRVAIVGRTGAGKSSLFQTLLRAHPIESGKIFIDGTIDLCQMDPRATRSIFGFVSQTPFIFRGTIRENLTVKCPKALHDDAILALISKAGLDDWLTRSGGLNAEVMESGNNFSFGEKQIICLCRLILSRPKIILIDEATAHMDDERHHLMNNLIRSTLPETTVLSIVHRMSGLDAFDWIVELSNGAIHRQGPPAVFQHK